MVGILDDTRAEDSDGVVDLPEQMNLILRYLSVHTKQRPLLLILNDIHHEPAVMQFITRVLGMKQNIPIFVLATTLVLRQM